MADPVRPATSTTLVIATRNRAATLDATLGTLAALPGSPPIVVVDNASEDDTADVVRRRHPDVVLVTLPRNRAAAARNVGASFARTPFVAFNDDDSWWDEAALGRAEQLFHRHPRMALAAARVLVGVDAVPDPATDAMRWSPLARMPDLPGRPVLGFLACAAMVRRKPFLAAGGFSPLLDFMGEETLLALDLTAAGWGVCFIDELVVHHHPAARGDTTRRDELAARNRVLTALLRRSPRAVRAEVRTLATRALRGDRSAAAALFRAAPRTPAALHRRRAVPPAVDDSLRQCESAAHAGHAEAHGGRGASRESGPPTRDADVLDVIAHVTDAAAGDRLIDAVRTSALAGARLVIVDERAPHSPPMRLPPGVEIVRLGDAERGGSVTNHAVRLARAPWVLTMAAAWRPEPWRFSEVAALAARAVRGPLPPAPFAPVAGTPSSWLLVPRDRLAATVGPRETAGPSRIDAILFDRDGTLVEDVPYNADPARVVLRPGAAEAVALVRRAGVRVGLVSNQSGVGRGVLTLDDVHMVNGRVEELVGPFDVVRVCPHHPEERCGCRKPEPGMVLDAVRALGVRAGHTWLVGDIGADVMAAHRAGAHAVLVPAATTLVDEIELAPAVCPTLLDAVRHVLARSDLS